MNIEIEKSTKVEFSKNTMAFGALRKAIEDMKAAGVPDTADVWISAGDGDQRDGSWARFHVSWK